jgi:hypothetical protein
MERLAFNINKLFLLRTLIVLQGVFLLIPILFLPFLLQYNMYAQSIFIGSMMGLGIIPLIKIGFVKNRLFSIFLIIESALFFITCLILWLFLYDTILLWFKISIFALGILLITRFLYLQKIKCLNKYNNCSLIQAILLLIIAMFTIFHLGGFIGICPPLLSGSLIQIAKSTYIEEI